MTPPTLVLRSRRVVTPEGIRAAAVHVAGEKITALAGYDELPAGAEVFDAGDAAVLPGVVDTHVHINEPGRTEWEGFETATRAAAAGGVTTLVEMPLNSIPATTSVAAFGEKLTAARGQCRVDVGFWGGIVPNNAGELAGLSDAGVFGFKCFLVPSGVEEFPAVTEADLAATLPVVAERNVPVLVHAELPGPIEQAAAAAAASNARSYRTWLGARPRAAENAAIELVLRLCREMRARFHIVHLSSSDAVPLLRNARADGLPISVETCPHYLHLAAEDIPDGATEFKCAPPIRERENREALWAALDEGIIDLVASDHSPCPPERKRRGAGDFLAAWGGIASLELSLPVVWTEARRRGYSLSHLAEWMCRAPARLAGLAQRKGGIFPGADADLVVFEPETTATVDPARLRQRHKLTPYAGRELSGAVRATFLRGRKIFERGEFFGPPAGEILLRGRT